MGYVQLTSGGWSRYYIVDRIADPADQSRTPRKSKRAAAKSTTPQASPIGHGLPPTTPSQPTATGTIRASKAARRQHVHEADEVERDWMRMLIRVSCHCRSIRNECPS